MNVTLQRHCAKHIYVIPEGLRELMSDISREVLRVQPEDIYTFIADYLDALMITRENARVAARFVQELMDCAETIVDFLVRTGMKREEADSIASIIQTAFRSYIEKKGILKEDESVVIARIIEEANIPDEIAEAAATVIQDAFRKFKIKKERERDLLYGVIDWRIAARSAIKLYRKTGVNKEEAKKAANLIKAAYKGYYTRRAMERLKHLKDADEFMLEEVASGSYEENGDKKAKSVRIDFHTVVPHVDFVGAVVIEEDATIKDDISEMSKTGSVEFIQDLIVNTILSPIGEEKSIEGGSIKEAEVLEVVEDIPSAQDVPDVEELPEDVAMFARSLLEEILPGDDGAE